MVASSQEVNKVIKNVALKGGVTQGGSIKPYNRFKIEYTITKCRDATGAVKTKASERALDRQSAQCLGLNVELLRNPPAIEAASEKQRKEEEKEIRQLHIAFPYWGQLIYQSIQKFNENNLDTGKCRKLVYDLRHGEADHNAWKKLFNGIDPCLWKEVSKIPMN